MTGALGAWLPYRPAGAGPRLYCLPHAGGSASAFRPWRDGLAEVAVSPLQPPGRETRSGEPPHASLDELCAELADRLIAEAAGPYAVFGHSLGALVGFELVRAVLARGGPPPVHLFVSGCGAPGTLAPDAEGITDEEVLALMRGLGGTPEAFLADPRVARMLLPRVRADLTVRNSFRHRPAPPLDVPMTAFAADADPRVSVEDVAAWREETVGRFRLHTYEGGHFAVLDQQERTLSHVREALLPHLATTTAP
ncbi:thioesterase II family protein [Streptomyces profundus]|uniref:thioesterase II family protein n=1 Tax=Streptomyces profundus TaxID=2867410 RepID=UPI001D16BCDC|nr:thioesterase domain-containing protein [Streptomyces sp. MA3_2.13]UED82973.1 alpha/beta fold hydrolase [Streptomyces sp. MA3_2.13]